jgi:hypothetical protein
LDYFQGVVTEYLRANRSVFVNTECLIQLDDGDKQFKDRHWYCDAMAASFKDKTTYLCEITYSGTMQSLVSRLQAWQSNWAELTSAVLRDSGAPNDWKVQPWVFIPQKRRDVFNKKMSMLNPIVKEGSQMPRPRITYLEHVVPWEYKTWDRKLDALASDA